MRQSRRASMIEVGTNYAVGFVLAWVLGYYVLPLWGMEQSAAAATYVTAIYTAVSIARSYVVRRAFNLLTQ
jgi:hypothetical protein